MGYNRLGRMTALAFFVASAAAAADHAAHDTPLDLSANESLFGFFRKLFFIDFMPHGHCFWWRPEIVWLHAISDLVIGLSYFSISIMVVCFVKRRKDLPFHGMFQLFAAFIFLCGMTHFISIVTLWVPAYRIDGVVKALTAATSLITAVLLFPVIPQVMAFRSPKELEEKNDELLSEIANRKRAEAELAESKKDLELKVAERTEELSLTNERLELLIHGVREYAIYSTNAHGIIESWNTGAERLKGYASHEAIGKHLSIFYAVESLARADELLALAAKEGAIHEEGWRVRKDGTKFYARVSVTAVRDREGRLRGFYTVTRDASDGRNAAIALEHSRGILQDIIDNTPAVIYVKDPGGRFRLENRALVEGWGEGSSLIGKSDFDLYKAQPELAQVIRKNDLEVLASGKAVVIEEKSIRQNVVRYFLSTKFPLRLTPDEVGLCGISVDITDRRNALEELESKANELARSNGELAQFAFIASHDLKEPIRAVSSYAQMLERFYGAQLDDRAKLFLGYIVDGVKRMYTLIDDLLSYSRIGDSQSQATFTDMDAAARGAQANLSAQIAEANAKVTIAKPLPTVWITQHEALQIFQNLIGNAVKYRSQEAPEIEISAELDEHRVRFAVRDNGLGIERQYFDKIFILFQRLHTREEYSGTGIGLAICKKIVERYGGNIWVESRVGEGSTFFFTLPSSAKKIAKGG